MQGFEGTRRSSKTITIDAVVQPAYLLFQWCDSQPFIGAGQEKKICKLKILGYLIQKCVDCVKFLEHIKLAYFKALNSLVLDRRDFPMLGSGNS